MAVNTELRDSTLALFAGYQNNNSNTVSDFINYVFENITPSAGVFSSLTVNGGSVFNGNTTFALAGLMTVNGPAIHNGNLTVNGAAFACVGFSAAGNGSIGGTFQAGGDTLLAADLGVFGITGLGAATLTGTAAHFGGDNDLHIAVSNLQAGRELYMLNENPTGVVVVAGGDGTGTGVTMIGGPNDKIGFFNEIISSAKQEITALPPADLPEALVQIDEIKSILAAYNLVSLI